MNEEKNKLETYIHRHFEMKDGDMFMYNITFSLENVNMIVISNVGVHTISKDDLAKYGKDAKLSRPINDNPHIVNDHMKEAAYNILSKAGMLVQ